MSFSIWSLWAFDIFTMVASYLSVEDLAAQLILRNIQLLTYMIPVGVSMASVILIGSNIGIKNIQHAQDYARIISYIALVLAIGNVTLVNVTIERLIHVFSSSP